MVSHSCGKYCICPVHKTPLIWWPVGKDHACQDINCIYGHGGLTSIRIMEIYVSNLPKA